MEEQEKGGSRVLPNKKHVAMLKFRMTEQLMRRVVERSVAGTGLYRGQHQMLMHLFHCPDCTQAALAEHMEVSPAAVAVGLKKLEKGGYVERENVQHDNRRNRITLTEQGQRVVDESMLIFHRIDSCIFQDFSDQELEQFIGMLDRIYDNLDRCGSLTEKSKGSEV